jgi:3-dehydroquinate dehydratase/shikimate dehydrogenase
MICISVAQESRRFALVDMLNAAPQCDLLEVRLDRFDKAPDIGELLAAKTKPVIFSCRRPRDGGTWEGGEDERLALLRQCIISKADYVEIEVDVADQIRRLPPAKRVISYTNLRETPDDIAAIYALAQSKSPDVIKLATVARTPEEAWPLVQILARPAVPTVVVGLGKPGVMLTVLGKKIGAPWTYAALERGMEAYPDQPTVHDLEAIYHYRALDRSTRLIGVTGFSERESATLAVLNAALAHLKLPARCLPLGVGSLRLFRKIADAVRLAALVADREHENSLLGMADKLNPAAQEAEAADLFLHKDDHWKGYQTRYGAAVTALEATLRARSAAGAPLHDRAVLILGTSAGARALAAEVKRRGGMPIIASHDRAAAHGLAQALECRYVAFEALYATMHDVLAVCDEEHGPGWRPGQPVVHPGYLKSSMAVMDLTAGVRKSVLLQEAEARGCATVAPRRVLLEQLALQVGRITKQDVDREVLERAIPDFLEDEPQ